MNTVSIVLVCVACLFIGYNIGYWRSSVDFDKIIDTYKETIEIYRNELRKQGLIH